MKTSTNILIAASAIASLSLGSTTALACNGGYSYRSYTTPTYPRYVEHAYITIPAPSVQQAFAGGSPQGFPQAPQFGAQGRLPSVGGFAPQAQGFAQPLPNGLPQGAAPGPQGQPLGPQQLPENLPQPSQSGAQSQPPMGLAPMGPQPLEGAANKNETVAQRIAEELTGFPGLPSGATAGQSAGPVNRPMPSILIGSVMSINGQPLGDGRGTVRLIVNGSPVTLEILEWAANLAKVRIPANLPADLQVQIEIVRADGSVVAKDTVKLAAGQPMAAAK